MAIELMIGTVRARALIALHRFGRWCQRCSERGLRAEIRHWEAKR